LKGQKVDATKATEVPSYLRTFSSLVSPRPPANQCKPSETATEITQPNSAAEIAQACFPIPIFAHLSSALNIILHFIAYYPDITYLMEGDKQDLLAPGVCEMLKNGSLAVGAADSQVSNDGRPSPAQPNIASMILQEQEGLEPLLRAMLAALQRIESLLEGQQKDPEPRREPVRKDSGDGEAMDKTKPVSQQELPNGRTHG
jgi:hypothetical protein